MSDKDVKYTLTLNDLLTNKLYQADGAANKLESSIGGIQGALGALGVAVGLAGVTTFISSMVTAGTKVEDARTGLTTLLKDGNEAQRVINQTMEDATKTPFAFEGLLSANKALISAGEGADGARAAVLDLGNAIAATGGGDDEMQRMVVNMQQIRNTGKATAMDIKQFAFAGINIYKVLAEATGKQEEKVKDMEISYDLLTMALHKAHEAGGTYANGLENMAGNTSVQISNLGDAAFQLKVKMFEDLKPAVDAVVNSGQNFIVTLREGWDWMIANKDGLTSIAEGLGAIAILWGAYIVQQKLVAFWSSAQVTASTLAFAWDMARAEGLGIVTAAQWALNIAMDANPIGIVIAAIGILVTGFIYAYNKSETFRQGVLVLWEVLKVVGTAIGTFYMGLGKMILGALILDPEMIKSGWADTVGAFQGIGKKIGEATMKGMADGLDTPKVTVKKPGETAKPGDIKAKPAATTTSTTPKAQANKAVTVNISIDKLIEQFKIETTNVTESTAKIKDLVSNAILSAVNQASLHADL